MSTIERNKGKLIPVTLGEWIKDFPDADYEDLEWGWQEGINLRSKDPELWMQIYELIPEVINAK